MRLAINLLITTALLFAFNAFGWLTLSHNGAHVESDIAKLDWPTFGSILLIAVVLLIAGIVVGILYGISVLVTLGIGLLAYPFIGWLILKATEHFMPGTLSLHGFWITVLCGWLLMIVRIPAPSKN